jgi:hypothetical protein
MVAPIRKPHIFINGIELKTCPKCLENKELHMFSKDKSRRDGLYPHCRACDKARHDPAVYVPKNKEWREAHREESRVYKREYLANKRANDQLFKLKELLRSRLRNALEGKKKSDRAVNLVGCSLEDLKAHLESTFQEGMTWDNQGEWHVDHIIPCVAFELEDPVEQKACFHYRNLQALWKVDNSRKGGRYTEQDKIEYLKNFQIKETAV